MSSKSVSLNQGLEAFTNTASSFGFSAVSLNSLTGTDQYTLVTIAVDKSGSVSSYVNDINKVIASVVEACRKSPRADNLLLRVVEFDHRQSELHGFKQLMDCNVGDYVQSNMANLGGSTALFDTTLNAIESAVKYGKQLVSQDYAANAIVVIVTDGDDNASKVSPKFIKDELANAKKSESVESVLAILVGVNSTNTLDAYLDSFKTSAGFDQYVGIPDASPNKLARLAQFISKSVSSQSQSLVNGTGKSQTLTF